MGSGKRTLTTSAIVLVCAVTVLGVPAEASADVSVISWEDSALCRMVKPWLSALSRDTVEF
ncbi:hypothetical protein ABZX34_04925, partial [Streptomyces sp. NPDC004362]